MVLLLRFIFSIVLGALRPRLAVLDESRVRFTVLPHDCDLNIHLNGGRLVSFMDAARMDLLTRVGLVRRLLQRGWRPVMGGIVLRYRQSILPFERFDIRSRVVGWDEKWFYLEHVVERNGVFCASAYMRLIIRARHQSLPPRDVLELIDSAGIASPPLPEFVSAWRNAEDLR